MTCLKLKEERLVSFFTSCSYHDYNYNHFNPFRFDNILLLGWKCNSNFLYCLIIDMLTVSN